MTQPLAGLLVVSLEQAVAAPYCTAQLADAGARVIKVEREGGDFARGYDKAVGGTSAWFVWLNRGKESLLLDIKAPRDAALLHRLLARADVLVQNLAPGATARAGFGADTLRRAHPRLITCDITGYGESGPYREMRAYDMLVQGESGLASVTGTADAPGRIGVSACDIGTGMNAHAAILRALYTRERTGQGSAVTVSMFDSMADWMGAPLLIYDSTGRVLPRTGLAHPLIAPYGAFRVQDGGELLIAVQNEREWERLARHVLERPALLERAEFASNASRVEHREALHAELAPLFAALPRETLEARLRAQQMAYGAINTVAELARHPALRRANVETARGPVTVPAPPLRERGEPQASRDLGAVPALGEHTERIRAEFAE